MKVLDTTKTESTTLDPYEDPVEYLAALGIEAEIVAVFENPLAQAA